MADLILFRLRGHPPLTLGHLFDRAFLFVFSLFLLFGNFFRLLPLTSFPSHFSLVELLLYVLAIPKYFSVGRMSHLLVAFVGISAFYGILLNGWDGTSVLYGARLIGMIAAGTILGEMLRKKEEPLDFILRLFSALCLLGFVLFFVFPKAHLFFALLDNWGTHFLGDPHQRRFISPFFDPNYYGAIACIPLLLALWLKRPFIFFFILTSIFLTFSRSGIATALIALPMFAIFSYRRILFFFLFFLPFLSLPFVFFDPLLHMVERTIHLFNDPSSLARMETFGAGFAIFKLHPFFGMGYHFLSAPFFEEFARLSPDASLLITLIDFGLIPTLFFALYGLFWSFRILKRGTPLVYCFYFYLLVALFFTSLFNNLLYYPYWLIPMIGIFSYLQKSLEGQDAMRNRP